MATTILFSIKYISAAILGSGVSSWNRELYLFDICEKQSDVFIIKLTSNRGWKYEIYVILIIILLTSINILISDQQRIESKLNRIIMHFEIPEL